MEERDLSESEKSELRRLALRAWIEDAGREFTELDRSIAELERDLDEPPEDEVANEVLRSAEAKR